MVTYLPFEWWCKKFINDDTAFGDIARDVRHKGWVIPTFTRKQDIMNYVKATKHWNDAGVETISEMLDVYHEELLLPYWQERLSLYQHPSSQKRHKTRIELWYDIRKGGVE